MESDNGHASADGESTYSASDEGGSDANAEDQHGYDTAEEQEIDVDAEVQASEPPGRRRRKRKVGQWPNDQIVVTELTEDGMPTEKKAQIRMRKLAGLIARQRLYLAMPSFNELTEEDKKQLFDECVQPSLHFAEPLRARACKMVMRIVNKSWRTHKSELVRCFVRKGLDAREKHPYIPRQDWLAFVALQETEEAKEKSEKYKQLRERNKHNHCLGTAGYAGKAEKWAQEDMELAAEGISNPWDKFPDDRSRNFLRARSKLVKSKGSAEIHWVSKSAKRVSQQIIEKQADLASSGLTDTSVRDKDVLTQVLGQPEQTGRVRGVSSYNGWKYWPDCSSMYRKRKRSDVDVEALKEELRSQVTEEVREKVTKDIMAMLREQGVNLGLPSNTVPSAGGMKSSCASSDVVQLDGPDGISYPNHVDLLTHPALCTLVFNQVEVAKGKVFPQQTELDSVTVQDGYVVVHVHFVYPEHEDFVLTPRPSAEITTLGEALYKRIQWRKVGIVVSPQGVSLKGSLGPSTLHGGSAKSSLKDLVVSNVPSSIDEKVKSARTVGNCASKENTEGNKRTNKCTCDPAGLPLASRAPKSDTKRDHKVVVKQKQVVEPPKSSKTPVASVWIRPNSKFNFGQPMLSAKEVEKAGPGCIALHAHYMKACAENRNTGIVGRIEHHHFWRALEPEPLAVGFEDLFDLLTLDALDVALLRVVTLSLIVEARGKSLPVALLDPDALSIKSLSSDRDYSVAYLERCLRKYDQQRYVMFAHNCGGHWIAVVIVPNCQKVLYLDSNRGRKTDLSGLKSVIDEAYGNIQPQAKKVHKKGKLTHATKIRCLQQGLDNTCGFYVAHNLMLAMAQANLDNSEEFDVVSMPISLEDIREKIAMFIKSEIMEPKGEFYDPEKNKEC